MGRHGLYGWVVMAIGIGAYDCWAKVTRHETLSAACHRMCNTRSGRVLATATWLGVGWHLLVTEHRLAQALDRRKEMRTKAAYRPSGMPPLPLDNRSTPVVRKYFAH